MQTHSPTTDLVLLGGGHSHLSVIKQFGMRPLNGLRITVISRDIHTPYSGMIPGLIAGHYTLDDTHIDLRPLCEFAGARLFHSEVTRIDLKQKLIYCLNRPPVRFDYLSINTGSHPDLSKINGAQELGIPVKPINTFINHWQAVLHSLKENPRQSTIAVVGGGAASVEIILAMQYQLQQSLGFSAKDVCFELLCAAPNILNGHNPKVEHFFSNKLKERGIKVQTRCTVLSVQTDSSSSQQQLQLSTAQPLLCDTLIWAVQAGSPDWTRQSGLRCNTKGFIEVNQSLQSLSHANVFAAGDVAHFVAQPLPKSGVYAVRAGKILAKNLRRMIQGKTLIKYQPQQRFLSLLMTGNQVAVVSRGALFTHGAWAWRLKNHIDKKFIKSFSQLPLMTGANQPSINKSLTHTPPAETMRCGGCGAKVSQRILSRVMAQLKPINNSDVAIGLNAPDDAAVITPPSGKQWLQTVDYFRAFINDPYLLGRIATNHCLSDIYAMGATPHSALAIASIPYASEPIIEDTLLQLMSGAVQSLNEQNTALIGGHSSEGAELGFGLSVNGVIKPEHLLTKAKLKTGQQLILTKAIGTGTLFAANMLGKAQGQWIEQALQHMLINNRQAAQIIHQHQATACTDITGFGLIGHLIEMLKATDNVAAQLYINRLPLLNGATYCASKGWLSSLQTENQQAQQAIINRESFINESAYPLLFDPQTSGGLLAAIPANQAQACLQALHQADCPEAAIIGEINAELPTATISLSKPI